MRYDASSKIRSILFRAALFVLAAFIAALCIRPTDFNMPSPGLDPSWVAATDYAVKNGLVFGREFVFTMGPLSALYHRLYPHELAPLIILIGVMWFFVFAIILNRLVTEQLRGGRRILFLILAIVLTVLASPYLVQDAIIYFSALSVGLLYSRRNAGMVFLLVSIFVLAAFCLAKFSFAVMVLPVVFVIDALSIYRREIPYKTAFFVLSVAILFSMSGQSLADLPEFVRASIDVTRGYTAAMSSSGPWLEAILWAATSGLVVGVAVVSTSRAFRDGRPARWDAAARLLLLMIYLGVSLKAGFVRHDGHSLIAWAALLLIVPAFADPTIAIRHIQPLLVPLLASFLFLSATSVMQSRGASLDPVRLVEQAAANIQRVFAFVKDRNGWMTVKEAEFSAASNLIRIGSWSSEIGSGSVDVVPSRQSEVIASGLSYQPRPSVQEYTTYTRQLIDRNRDFFLSERAPDYLLFAPGSIDSRHPASAEGPLWPLFLQLYEPVKRAGDLVVLKKRQKRLANILKEPTSFNALLGERVSIPPSAAPLFVKIEARYNALGALANLAFKAPLLFMTAIYQDGSTERYRLIPEIAREGSVLVPTISSAGAFAQLYAGPAGIKDLRRPIAFEVEPTRGGSWAYKTNVSFAFSEMSADGLNSQLKMTGIEALAATNKMSPPLLNFADEGLFAHAPSELTAKVEGASVLDLQFGIRDTAWQGNGNVTGVCFSVLGQADIPIFSRCLKPKSVPEDRGVQSSHFAIPPGTTEVKFRTTCVESCNWAWSYWAKADFTSQP